MGTQFTEVDVFVFKSKRGGTGNNFQAFHSSQGIDDFFGYAIAEGFLKEGARVGLTGRSEEPLREAAETLAGTYGDGNVMYVAGDMTATEDIARALDEVQAGLGPVDHVVANVGIGRAMPGMDVSDEDWAADVLQNFTGSMYLARESVSRMKARPKEGRGQPTVTFISSIGGVDAIGTSLPYGSSKAALNHATREMAKVVGKEDIRINTVAPGNIMFPGGNWERIVAGNPDYFEEWINREVALKRFGTCEEIANAVVFVASDRASFVTGEVFVVDGGQVK